MDLLVARLHGNFANLETVDVTFDTPGGPLREQGVPIVGEYALGIDVSGGR